MLKKYIAAAGFVAVTALSRQAGAYTLTNTSFENGTNQYIATPGVNIVTSSTSNSGTYTATDGKYFAELNSTGGGDCGLFNGTSCSGLGTLITLKKGNTFKFDWAFLTDDYLPWNDFSLFVGDGIYDLGDVASVGNGGDSGWQTFSWTASSDFSAPVLWIASNSIDNLVNSKLLLDNIQILPEPGSMALLGLGLLGMGYSRRRKANAV